MSPRNLLDLAQSQLPWIEQHTRELVLIESPTEDKAGVDRAAAYVATLAEALGARAKYNKQKDFGDILELTFGPPDPRVLVLGHLDTVWPKNTLKSMPWKSGNGRFSGPGVLDMRAGIIMCLCAAKILQQDGLHPHFRLLLNSEEEVGSPVSRPITERLALGSRAVFVLEPAQGLAYKTARKGVGHYVIDVKGVAAHSGVDFESGHSAIRELARLVETTSNFTDLNHGRTINCGVITGGTRSNVVAEHARCEIDVRVATSSDAAEVDALFRGLKSSNPACFVSVTGGMNRPPMERSKGTAALFARARTFAGKMGLDLQEAATGGGSDGNFTAALGIPTLDGMGAVGAGAHAAHEHILIEHLAPRTALLAAMINCTSFL